MDEANGVHGTGSAAETSARAGADRRALILRIAALSAVVTGALAVKFAVPWSGRSATLSDHLPMATTFFFMGLILLSVDRRHVHERTVWFVAYVLYLWLTF